MDYYKDDQNYNLNDENILDQEIKKVKKKRKYYTSNNQDLLIRNGITGDKYGFKKGSKSELALFKVMDTTGRVDEEGFILTKRKNNPTTNTIYYNSPEEYQRFVGKKLPDYLILNWRKRNMNSKINTNEEKEVSPGIVTVSKAR